MIRPDRRSISEPDRGRDAALAAKIRANAWLLAGLAVAFYVGYIAWNFMGGPLG